MEPCIVDHRGRTVGAPADNFATFGPSPVPPLVLGPSFRFKKASIRVLTSRAKGAVSTRTALGIGADTRTQRDAGDAGVD
eukprot:CAMPEP_0181396534 /NCGR_PEP_ID=MMETSP1106-20121128/28920_1 /TAXON_ID=81844 /ORGANISM="Mantoniella antarctica, Strain SL-175" /LENGTH=79 /DNA_ID=CAMNT_0023518219 /DNA_START=552 /DNA_END=788 /DNA_ORIENTATION=+